MKDPIDFYYESLSGAYEQLEAWTERVTHPPLGARLRFLLTMPVWLAFMVCLLPFVPVVAVSTLYPNYTAVRIDTVLVTIIVWGGLAVATGFLATRVQNASDRALRPDPPVKLSPDQLTFLEAYSAQRHLQMYFAAFLTDSLRQAQAHARRVFRQEGLALFYVADEDFDPSVVANLHLLTHPEGNESNVLIEATRRCGWWRHTRVMRNVLQLPTETPWFTLVQPDRDRLDALVQLGPRVMANLKAEANLPQVKDVLSAFVDYTYRTLPEHSTRLDADSLAQVRAGIGPTLDALLVAVATLPEDVAEERASPAATKAPALNAWSRRPIVRVTGYFLALSALFTLVALGLRLILTLSDDTVALAVLPTAGVVAVWLASLAPHEGSTDAKQ